MTSRAGTVLGHPLSPTSCEDDDETVLNDQEVASTLVTRSIRDASLKLRDSSVPLRDGMQRDASMTLRDTFVTLIHISVTLRDSFVSPQNTCPCWTLLMKRTKLHVWLAASGKSVWRTELDISSGIVTQVFF